jgi:hypothetical protein
VNAIAITANDPLGMLGGVIPLKGTRGGAPFDNLFSAFGSPGTVSVKASPVAKAPATATSKQIANAMIQTMLTAPVNVPVASLLSATLMEPGVPQESENSGAAPSPDVSSRAADHPPLDPAPAQTSTRGDALLRSMLGIESSPVQAQQMDETKEAAVQSEVSDATAVGQENTTLATPPRKTSDTANEFASQASPKSRQGGPSQVTVTPEAATVSATIQGMTPQASVAMTQSTAPKLEASSAGISNGPPMQTVAIMHPAAIATEIPDRPTGAEAVARNLEPEKIADALAPLAFSVELKPILAEQAAPITNSGLITAPDDVLQASQPAASPPEVSQPVASQPQPTVSQSALTPPKNFETPVVAGENDKTRPVAPPQREGGNTGGRGDRPQERETRDDLKNEAPDGQIQALAGASALSGGWTIGADTAEVPAGPAAPTVRTPQTGDPVPLPAATNTAAPVTVQSPAVQEIAVRISQPDSPAVDLHVTEHAGEIHVAVRTPDVELQASLRQDLGTLTNSLERAGYHAETFVPRSVAGAQSNLRDERQGTQPGFSGRGGSQGESGSGKQKGQREQRGASWLKEQEQST